MTGRDWYYNVYLTSAHWWNVDQRARDRAGACCEFCGAPEWNPEEGEANALSVHHLNYDRMWNERDEDLIVLCKSCHTDAHKFPKRLDEIKRFAARRVAATTGYRDPGDETA